MLPDRFGVVHWFVRHGGFDLVERLQLAQHGSQLFVIKATTNFAEVLQSITLGWVGQMQGAEGARAVPFAPGVAGDQALGCTPNFDLLPR